MGGAQAKDQAVQVDNRTMANAIRALSMDGVEAANSGHPGMPMGMADVATVLFGEHLKFKADDPAWPDRDRFVLSAGHGSMLLYSLLYLTGYPGMDIEQLRNFRQLGFKTAGHPEYGHAPGIETTTGPLGQGIANAVGMALAERLLNARMGDDLVNHHIYCIAGDGCLMEGVSQEAISLAGHLGLGKLIVLFDDNSITIDGPTDLSVSDNQLARFQASGWNTTQVDGHNAAEISAAIANAKADESKPWLIACKTIIGYGAPNKQGTSATHGAALGAEEIKAARDELNWPYAPFDIPQDIMDAWRALGQRSNDAYEEWQQAFNNADADGKAVFRLPVARNCADAMKKAIAAAKAQFASDHASRATRVWSQLTLDHLIPAVPELIGGSADLTGSNGTRTKEHHTPISKGSFSGNYINYGVREHGMAAAMNGMALHGGIIPYGATFLVFTDYCRPSIRLSALMEQRVIYVMTHDSIGLGEDGPTHQPVEHLSALRAMPNLLVLRPADAIETAECWQIALENEKRPSVLVLSRQSVPTMLRCVGLDENLAAKGAYVIDDAGGDRHVTLLATGSEVGLATSAASMLAAEGVKAAIVSMPSFELFREQSPSYQKLVLGVAPRIAIEAAVKQSWYEWLRPGDQFVGMNSFGASAPAASLFDHFGITAGAIFDAAQASLKNA